MADPKDPRSGPPDLPPPASDVKPVQITDEMRRSYLDYAMSVIVSRALPDARDGLKPVHRRILYTMFENGFTPDKPYKKSARVVGDVMGKYHPHGNLAIYDALVRMAQDFSMRLPLIDGQGNFGSIDNDPPAADRYTEARLDKAAMPLLDDLDKDTVNFTANYSGEFEEPSVLPAKYPNLLVNGAGGIAVGMATNIPPHNLGEVIDACTAYIDDPAISIDDLIEIVPGPDFPTGAQILGQAGARAAYHLGRGSIIMRAKWHTEEMRREREAIVFTEIPYQVNKAHLVEKIGELVREKKLEGIAELRDESDRDGIRVVVEIKRDAVVDVVLNQLYRYTALQTSFGANIVALNGGRPEVMNLKDLIRAFVDFREEVVSRRTKFLLGKARERAHVLCGLAIAVANIDEVIRLIRAAPDPNSAREELMGRDWPARDIAPLIALVDDPRHRLAEDGSYRLSEAQARAILDLRLQRLTALGREEVGGELTKLAAEISDYLDILRSRVRILTIVKDELKAVREAFATPRRSEIVAWDSDVEDEDLIQREDMVVTVSHAGYIKRVPLSTYRAQRRGGKGRSGMQTREEDFVTRLFVANTHTPVLFFSSLGQVYKEKVWRLPLAAPNAKGRFLRGMLPLEEGERITTIMPLPEDEASWDRLDVMFATRSGSVRRNKLSDFVQVNRAGKIAMKLDEGDEIVDVQICSEADDVLLDDGEGPMHPLPRSTRNGARVRGPRTRSACAASSSAKATASSRWRSCAIRREPGGADDVSEAVRAIRRAPRPARNRAGGGADRRMAETRRRAGVPEVEPGTDTPQMGRGRAVRADGSENRLRQAHLVLRVPDHRDAAARASRDHGVKRAQRPARRRLPGRDSDEIMLITNEGKTHPRAGRRHPHRQPRLEGRDACSRPATATASSRSSTSRARTRRGAGEGA